ncbi:MBL fold metallo-hydrolase [Streptomyces sp. NPDC057580]|uniref:MBL fold metallo-hydrolase n=1 Tax=Streptomyces sp. NPDC057580 TaxID=3346173 RepID=UPI0036A42A74
MSDTHIPRPRRIPERMPAPPKSGTHLVLLGTRAGPHPEMRASAVSALVVDGAVYLVDAGAGLIQRFHEASLDFGELRSMFITHLHSDHIADYFMFFNVNFPLWKHETQQIPVFGPGRADRYGPAGSATPGMPDLADTPVIAPALPTPGIVEMTELLKQAYAFELNNAIRTTRRPGGSPKAFTGETGRPMIVPQAVDVPAGAHVDNASPVMEPVKVYQDDRVTVTATLVDHPPVFPAFAYRFDTPHGSVVFSGDTTSCSNLVDLATGADVLVNEVVAVDEAVAMYEETDLADTYRRQFLTAHTPLVSHGTPGEDGYVPGVGAVAAAAGVKALVLTHLYPADGRVSEERFHADASSEFDGTVIVGDDLQSYDIGALAQGRQAG